MNRLNQTAAVSALAVLLVAGAAAGAYALSGGWGDLCGNTVVAEALSPDQRHRAVVFQRDCGATTGLLSTQVSVIGARDALPDEGGNAFVADGHPGVRPDAPVGGPAVHVRWASAASLRISHRAGMRVFKQQPQVSGIKVAYEPF